MNQILGDKLLDVVQSLPGMLVVVAPLEAEEIYRITLAQNITNDRSPVMFIRASNEVIRKNTDRQYPLIQFDVLKIDREFLQNFIESDCGCDIAQGFYYARPMPVEEFEKLLGM